MKTCSYCGKPNDDSATRCGDCQTSFSVPAAAARQPAPLTSNPMLAQATMRDWFRFVLRGFGLFLIYRGVINLFGLAGMMLATGNNLGFLHGGVFRAAVLPLITTALELYIGKYFLRDGSHVLNWAYPQPENLSVQESK